MCILDELYLQYQLGLPIRVEIGLIGKIILKIPWSGLFSQPIVICIEVLNNLYITISHNNKIYKYIN